MIGWTHDVCGLRAEESDEEDVAGTGRGVRCYPVVAGGGGKTCTSSFEAVTDETTQRDEEAIDENSPMVRTRVVVVA